MRKILRVVPLLLLAANPALADRDTAWAARASIGDDAAAQSVMKTLVEPAPPVVSTALAAGAGPAEGICDLVADPANKTHWLAYKQLDQWMPCESGRAIGVRFLVSSIADAAQAHFCAPQQSAARQQGAGNELGYLRCTYAGQDLATGRKSGNWEMKPLTAAVPYRMGTASEPLIGPARAVTTAAADEAGAAGRTGRSARSTRSAKAARVVLPASGQ